MPAHDLALLSHAARAAGNIALRYWKNAPKSWEKGDQGPVTEADLAVNDMLFQTLRGARPAYGWLSEETPDDPARLSCEHVFIIDPIDGTRAFIAGESHFSHSLAIARNGVVTAAAVYLPVLDRLYTAVQDAPALVDGTPSNSSTKTLADGANILTSKQSLLPDLWHTPPPAFKRSFRASLAYRLCLVAEGAFDGMITLRDTWEWDIAAGSLIAAQSGATVSDKFGHPLQFNTKSAQAAGTFAAAPAIHAGLMAHLNA